jgi:hypothetical protein
MKFNLCLQAKFWRTSPSISIKLDDKSLLTVNNFIDGEKKDFELDVDLEQGEHQFIIERTNKTTSDTIVDKSTIIKDSTVDILDLVIDKISIEPLLDQARFYPQYPEPWSSQQRAAGKKLPTWYDYCRTLHHNGEWKLDFTSPIHIWFFQNIKIQI